MPAYNSVFNSEPDPRLIGNFPLLPLRTKVRGPAYTLPLPSPPLAASESPDPDSESYDILDEGPADRLLIYGIWFLSDCLTKIKPNATVRDAQKEMYEPPRDRQDAEQLRQYMAQIRQELAIRIHARVYEEDEAKPSKWWLSFTKRKFMGKAL
ncbi:hypothetical protein V2A60_008794 [Cordyceps javanica]